MPEKMGKGGKEINNQDKLAHLDFLPDSESISSDRQARQIINDMSVNNKKRIHNLQELVVGEIAFILLGVLCIVGAFVDGEDIIFGLFLSVGIFLIVCAFILLLWFILTFPTIKECATKEDDILQDWYRKVCQHLANPKQDNNIDNMSIESTYTPIDTHRPEDDLNK